MDGIAFAFERMPRTPNTFASHRVVHFAAREGLQNEAVEALFHAVFVAGRDIGDFETLVDIGAECGIDPVALAEYLASTEEVDALRAGRGTFAADGGDGSAVLHHRRPDTR